MTLRDRIRRGVDLAVFSGVTLLLVIAVIDQIRGTFHEPAIAAVAMTGLAGCALLGLLGRAPWTPIAYIILIIIVNTSYLAQEGTWFGLGTVYILAISLACLFVPRHAWLVAVALVSTPLVLGVLMELGWIAFRPSLVLSDASAWQRAVFGSFTAQVAVAVTISYAVSQLIKERESSETALALERAARIERMQVEDELSRARRADAIARLAAEVGADIGQALAIVQARAATLAQGLATTDAVDCLGDILEASTTAASTMRSLTAFAPEPLAEVRGNAANAIRALPKLVRRMIPAKVELETVADDDAYVRVHTTDLSRICANLVLNARDAIPDVGAISVRLTREATCVRIEVRDTGTGMDDATLANLFQPFFTTKPVGRGTGLGLATSRILVERAGGTIEVASALGRGTTFTIRLPLVA